MVRLTHLRIHARIWATALGLGLLTVACVSDGGPATEAGSDFVRAAPGTPTTTTSSDDGEPSEAPSWSLTALDVAVDADAGTIVSSIDVNGDRVVDQVRVTTQIGGDTVVGRDRTWRSDSGVGGTVRVRATARDVLEHTRSAQALVDFPGSSAWPAWRGDRANTGRSAVATEAATGAVRWSVQDDWAYPYAGPILLADGTVVQVAMDRVYAVAPTGGEVWRLDGTAVDHPDTWAASTPDVPFYSTPVLTRDGDLLAIGAVSSGWTAAVDDCAVTQWAADGTTQAVAAEIAWGESVCPSQWQRGAGILDDGTVLPLDGRADVDALGHAAVGPDGTVYAVRTYRGLDAFAPDGTRRWRFATGTSTPNLAAPVATTDGVVFAGGDGVVYALGGDGTLRWTYDTDSAFLIASPALAADGTIYAGAVDGKLYALSATGALQWTYDAGIGFFMSSPTIGGAGQIVFGTIDGRVVAVDADGALAWETDVGGEVYASPAIGADGSVYVLANNDGEDYDAEGFPGSVWGDATSGGFELSTHAGTATTLYAFD